MERAMKKRLAALCLLALTAGMLTACGGSDSGNAGKKGRNSEAETVPVPEDAIDADEYFEENGKVLHKTDAEKSKKVRNERSVSKMMTQRGFEDLPLEPMYSMDGAYTDNAEIAADGTEKHPVYSAVYTAESGDLWCIYIIGDKVMADPVFYNYYTDPAPEVPVMLSESKTVTSYDSVTNQFYETVPDPAVMDVRVVKKIDAETLETLSKEGLDG